MRRATKILLATMLVTQSWPGPTRDRLGVFGGWGAFFDAQPGRCFAISEPASRSRRGDWRPFASIGNWPRQGVRGQLHIRLRYRKQPRAPVFLSIDDRRFRLIAGAADAWAPDARADRAIVAAIRSGRSMSVETVSAAGTPYADAYRLRGAASAIDAAALACAKLR